MTSGLPTARQIHFCRNLMKFNGNAYQAYVATFEPTVQTVTDKQRVQGRASAMLKNKNVRTMLECMAIDARQQAMEELKIDTNTQIRKLEDIYLAAKLKEEFTPAISAINSQSKHLGLISDKPTTTVNVNLAQAEAELRNVSPEQRRQLKMILETEVAIEDYANSRQLLPEKDRFVGG